MDKQAVFEHYCKVLDDARESSMLFSSLLIYSYNMEDMHLGDITVECGATRATVIDPDYDYVVKFDINNAQNASEREANVYEHAVQDGMAQYFAEISYLGRYEREIVYFDCDSLYSGMSDEEFWNEVDGLEPRTMHISFPLYGCKKASCDWRHYGYTTLVERNFFLNKKSPLSERSTDVAVAFLRDYGKDEYERLADFCEYYGINDLHDGNVGDIDGKIVLIDYGSYYYQES